MRTWYYARNGRQFGPVGLDQIKLMLGTGGLDREDLVWREGMPAWLPAGGIEELNPPVVEPEEEITPSPPPPEAQDHRGPVAPPDGADIEPGSQPILVSFCLAHAWRKLKSQAPLLLAAGAVYVALILGASYLGDAIDQARGYQVPMLHPVPGDEAANKVFSELMGAPSLPVRLVETVLEWYLTLGMMRLALCVLRGQKAGLVQIFGEWRLFPKVVLANALYFALVLAGLLLMVVPGILAAVVFGQFRYGILERNMGVMEAFTFSARVTKNSLGALVMLGLITSLAILAGSFTLLVGLIPAVPFTLLVQAAAYHWLTKGARDAFEGK